MTKPRISSEWHDYWLHVTIKIPRIFMIEYKEDWKKRIIELFRKEVRNDGQ